MRELLESVHAGAITWAKFFALTEREWERIAASLHRRWSLPPAVEVCDLRQELQGEAFLAGADWRPGKMAFADFVLWRAVAGCKRWFHRQRKALRLSCRAQSRYAIPFSHLDDFEVEDLQSVSDDQEAQLIRAERIEEVCRRLTKLQAQVLRTFIRSQSLDETARTLYDDPFLSRRLRVGSIAEARTVVRAIAATAA